jgi:predicted transport protein
MGETNFNLSFPSSLSGSAYFTFETKRNVTGSYANVTPLGKGDKEVGVNSLIVLNQLVALMKQDIFGQQ